MVFRVGQPSAESAAGPGAESEGAFSGAARVSRLQQLLIGRLSATQSRTLSSLAGESDAELFGEGLLDLARRVENSDNLEAATLLYRWFESEACPSLPSVQARARRALNAIEGRGEVGARAEFLMGRFFHEASNPSAIFAMGAAGALFRMTRLATLARLGANPEVGFLTRGFGVRAASSLTGFAVEATAFPFLHRAGDAALGRSHPWDMNQLGSEVASSFLTLGALRLCGWGAGAAFRRTHGLSRDLAPGFTQQTFQQAGMFGGILLGHGLETMVGLRQRQDGATSMVDALAMLLQFNVAGNLTRRAFGQSFHTWERSLDLQAEALQRPQPRPPGTIFGQPILAMAVASGPASPGASSDLTPSASENLVRMEALANGRDGAIGGMLDSIERTIRAPGYLEGTREELLQKRVDPDLVDQVWLHQALEVLNGVRGIETRIVDDSVLFEHLAADQSAPKEGLVYEARRYLRSRGGEGSVARRVIEIRNNGLAEGEDFVPLVDLMEWLSFLNTSQQALGHQVHFVNEAGNPNYVARIVMPSYMESLLRAVHGENAMQFHYVDGAIPRDDVMRLRGQRVAPVGVARNPTYLQDTRGDVSPFGFLFHDAFFHAPLDSAKRGSYPEAAARLYRLLQRRPVEPGARSLDSLAELVEFTHEDGTPSMFGRVVPALLHDILGEVRRESDSFRRDQDFNDIHLITQTLSQIVERFPEAGQGSETQVEFAAQVENLQRALGVDLTPPELSYPPEIESAWQRVEAAWSDPAYYSGSRADLASRRPDSDDVDAIWLHQAQDYVRRRGGDFEIVDIGDLRHEHDEQGKSLFDPGFFDQVMAILGDRGREGSVARRVVRARYNDQAISIADMESPFLRYLYLAPMMDDVSFFAGGKANLSRYLPGDNGLQTHFASLSLTEAIFQAAGGKEASQFHYVPGNISRNLTMALRADRMTPVSLNRGLIHLGDLGFEVHPFCHTGHDATFHAARDSEQPDPFPEVGGWLYRTLDRRLPPGPLRERMLNNLSDSNLGGSRGTWQSFADAVLHPIRMTILDSQGDHRYEENQATLAQTLPVLEALRAVLAEDAPGQPHLSSQIRLLSGQLDLYSRRVDRVRRIAEEYRAAGVEVSPPFYDMETLDAIERIDAKFREPGYLEGSREELRQKRVSLADADRLWYAQIRDFARLLPKAHLQLAEIHHLLTPPVGRLDYNVQDTALLEAAFVRLERKATPFSEEARRVSLLEMPYNSMALDAAQNDPRLAFLRFDPFLNDLEAHLQYRVQFIEIDRDRDIRRYRIPSLAFVESLLEAANGEDRAQLHFVPGEISRDDTARLRGQRASPVGLSFSPIYIEEFQGPMHSYSFAQHDVFDHSSRDAMLGHGLPEAMHWLYREAQGALPAGPQRERLLDQLSDLDLPPITEDPWQNLSHRLSGAAREPSGTEAEFRQYLSSLERMIRDRFPHYPPLAQLQTRFLVDLRFVRSQWRNHGSPEPTE